MDVKSHPTLRHWPMNVLRLTQPDPLLPPGKTPPTQSFFLNIGEKKYFKMEETLIFGQKLGNKDIFYNVSGLNKVARRNLNLDTI